ncbi:hypothetical protein P175DRAFT_0503775 [Aspergillus ochraceoroseus IBT 24754]|uniref:VWFA domain-containing protein n=1 Tax=Aspergillus ochraceoroseus IBT 24754 TaxID=1392256 RepID=A0A2T5LRP4_9EURO|nr:uncharacterized protein P175DRAFT_0503775 [Aspergillus ochraceoroseus IBT 24754]PTU18950.1 hypothetical protein P175DRAFT_0503775 [Aspergillus ochraceoroseus IBT 24754]
MDNLLTFNLRVPVGVQVVSHLISENTIMEQFLLILSSSLGGCRYEKYRKEIEGFTNGSLTGLGRLELQSALALFAGKVADQILADFVPELSVLLGKSLPGAGDLPAIRNMGNASTATPSEATPEPQPEPEPVEEPPTPEAETKKQLNEFASKNLASFPQFSEEKIEQITDQAAASIQGIAAKSNIPDEEIPKAAQLAFYDFTILYDDSGSMTTEASRIPTTQETIRSLYKTAKTLNPDNSFSVRSFEGSNHDNVSSESDLSDVISGMTFNTGASVAAPLRNKILDPLSKAAADKTLNPTVVVIITDGDLGSNVVEFGAGLTNFKAQLDATNNTGPAVLFVLYRVGNDQSSEESLKELHTAPGAKDILLYNQDSIDSKLESVGGDTDIYVGTIISDLIKAMDLQVVR